MYVVNESFKGSVDGFEGLAQAIILQAVKDYKKALRGDAREWCREIEQFFHSDWFSVLTKVDPDAILQRVRKEVGA